MGEDRNKSENAQSCSGYIAQIDTMLSRAQLGGGRWGRAPPPAFHTLAKDMYLDMYIIEAQHILHLN